LQLTTIARRVLARPEFDLRQGRDTIMLKQLTIASAIALLWCIPAIAATPVVSGKYVFASWSVCQPDLTVTNSTGGDQGVQSLDFFFGNNNPGDTHYTSGTLTFDPTAGTAKAQGFQDGGTVLFLLHNSGSNEGQPFSEVPISGTMSYSNTANSFTLSGVTYHAFYGKVAGGIADFVEIMGLQNQNPPDCVQRIELTRTSGD
jgi:hypothetical protein